MAFLAILGTSAWSANTGRPAGRSVFAGNIALQRPITLSTRSIRLGELVDRISALTGVDLQVDDQSVDPVSGFTLTAVVQSRTAAETLEAIPALYSFPPDRWYWDRTQKEGAEPKYVLRHTLPHLASRQLREVMAKEALSRQFQKVSALYAASPQQRNKMAESDPMLAALNTPRNLDFLSFMQGLGEADVLTLMSGGIVDIPMSRLSQRQRAFVTNEFRSANLLGREGVVQPHEFEKISLEGAGLNEPSIFLNLGSVGSHAVLGGIWIDQELSTLSLKNWVSRSESAKAPEGDVPAPGVPLKPNDLRIQNTRYDSLLRRLGRLGRLNLLLDRTTPSAAERTYSADFPLAGKLSQLLPRLSYSRLLWKKRAAFLLFRPDDWQALDRGEVPSWPVVRDLRRAAVANSGYLRPEDWIRLGRFDREALEHLEEEFPDFGARQFSMVHQLMRLAFRVRESDRQQWNRDGGVGWDDLSPRARAALRQMEPQADLRRVRVLLQWKPDAKPPAGTFYLGYQDGVKNPVKLTFQKRVEPIEPDD